MGEADSGLRAPLTHDGSPLRPCSSCKMSPRGGGGGGGGGAIGDTPWEDHRDS